MKVKLPVSPVWYPQITHQTKARQEQEKDPFLPAPDCCSCSFSTLSVLSAETDFDESRFCDIASLPLRVGMLRAKPIETQVLKQSSISVSQNNRPRI